MDKFVLFINLHKQLFELLGYNLDVDYDTAFVDKPLNIFRNNKIVGTLFIEKRNIYWLNEDKVNVYNRDMSKVRYSKNKEKNIEYTFHTIIHDNNFNIDSFNIISGSSNIGLSNKYIDIKIIPRFVQDLVGTSIRYNKNENSSNISFMNDEMQTVFDINCKLMDLEDGIYTFDIVDFLNDKLNNIQGNDLIKNIVNGYKRQKGKSLKYMR